MSVQEKEAAAWQELVESHHAWYRARNQFLAAEIDRVGLLREALRGPDRLIALPVCPLLPTMDKQQLFPEFVKLARSVHGPFNAAWDLILGLPRDWVLSHIESEVDAILRNEEEDDYWMFLQLYSQLNRDLALKLAGRAAAHQDADIRELGEDYLTRLGEQAPAAN